MKKTLNINLGGIAFIIDENAFEWLHQYLETLKAKFKNASEREEILHDIEARIAEMLNQKQTDFKKVITLEDVQYVTDIMGKPEDIAGDAGQEFTSTSNNASEHVNAPIQHEARKRLFRDAEDAKVGGVLSGLCHYFGIKDAVWVRLAALILIPFTSGGIILLYILMLIIVPKALTSAEKLQMKGEPVNISTIEREIREAASKTGESVNSFVQEKNIFEKLWNILLTLTKTVLKLIAGLIIFFCLFVLAVLVLSMFGVAVAGNALLMHTPHLLVDNPITLTIFNIGVVLFIASPVIGLIYAALRALLGNERGRAPWLKWTLLATWWIGVFMIGYAVAVNVLQFKTTGTKHEQIVLMQPNNGIIKIQLTDSSGNALPATEEREDVNITINGVFINGQNLEDGDIFYIGKPSLQIMPSQNDSFYLEKIITSQGASKADAIKNAGYVNYNFSQIDSVVNLEGVTSLNKKGKYRAQRVKIRIHIPEGRSVKFADNIDLWAATVKGNSNYDDTYFANTAWINEKGTIKCIVGENHFNSDKEDEEIIKSKNPKKGKRKNSNTDQDEDWN